MLFHIADVFSVRQHTELLFLTLIDRPKPSQTLFASHSRSPRLGTQRPKELHNASKLKSTQPRKARGRAPYPLLQPPHFRQLISFPPSVTPHNLRSFSPNQPPILLRVHQQLFKDRPMRKVMETRSHS